MRVLKYILVVIAGVVMALGALIWEGGTLERALPIGEVPVVDFASLQRAPTDNQYLLCPEGMCGAQTDGAAPVFDTAAERLQGIWELTIGAEPQVQVIRRDPAIMQIDYVQRTPLMRFPDLVSVRFVPVDDTHSTVAIYSRSIYGLRDRGTNRTRIEGWLAKVKARLAS